MAEPTEESIEQLRNKLLLQHFEFAQSLADRQREFLAKEKPIRSYLEHSTVLRDARIMAGLVTDKTEHAVSVEIVKRDYGKLKDELNGNEG